MAVDLKLDIIYHNTPTDFEMEFSLSSRCVMRMLTSKSENTKEYLTALSRAVARSRVIICVGDIYNKNSVINITSQAVGLKLCSYDVQVYSVTDEKSKAVLLPDGALPLVSDGVIGGCVIESGPQIIIFLSDDKAIRKRILKELVFEYISALSGVKIETSEPEINEPEENIEPISEAASEEEPTEAEETEKVEAEAEEKTEEKNEAEIKADIEVAAEEVDENDENDETENTQSSIILSATENNEEQDNGLKDYIDQNLDQVDDEYIPRSNFVGLKVAIGVLCGVLAAIIGVLIYYYLG